MAIFMSPVRRPPRARLLRFKVHRRDKAVYPPGLYIQEFVPLMASRLTLPLLITSAFCLTACAVRSPEPAEAAPPAQSIVETGAPPEPGPMAEACVALLQRLDETGPLLAGIDDALEAQAERFDAAIATLSQPAPKPRALVCPPRMDGSLGGKEIIGAIEWLYMDPPGRHFRARVDSGAETSSLSASEVIEFERDGDEWVRFTFQHDSADESVRFELPIKRTVLIRQVSSDTPMRRFVVELDIRLGQQLQTTEFTLTDRSNMTYPVLLGRAFLMDLYVVDVSRSYTHERYDAT